MVGFQWKQCQIALGLLHKEPPVVCACVRSSAQCSICRTVTSVIVDSLLKRCWRGWRLDQEGAVRGRSQRVDGWIWIICFSDEKIFRIDAVAPGSSFHLFSWGKLGRRKKWASLYHAKTEGPSVTSGHFEPLFMTHPSEVGNPCTKKGASIMVSVGLCIDQQGVGHVCSLTRFLQRTTF